MTRLVRASLTVFLYFLPKTWYLLTPQTDMERQKRVYLQEFLIFTSQKWKVVAHKVNFMRNFHNWRTEVSRKSNCRWYMTREGLEFGRKERGLWEGSVLSLTCTSDVLSSRNRCVKKQRVVRAACLLGARWWRKCAGSCLPQEAQPDRPLGHLRRRQHSQQAAPPHPPPRQPQVVQQDAGPRDAAGLWSRGVRGGRVVRAVGMRRARRARRGRGGSGGSVAAAERCCCTGPGRAGKKRAIKSGAGRGDRENWWRAYFYHKRREFANC